ncbi:hypothetical protein WA026_022622, partial [Henosepilachna vigintioctopunctata]
TSVPEPKALTSQLTLPQTNADNNQSVDDFEAVISKKLPVPDVSKEELSYVEEMLKKVQQVRKTVTDEEDGLLSDGCLHWSHRQCLGLSMKTYQNLSEFQESWYCGEICKNKESPRPPPQQSPKHYSINDVMTKLEEMDKKYNSLFKQYSGQITINKELKSGVGVMKREINKNEQK